MAKGMEESVVNPSHRLIEDNMVQDYTRYIPTKVRLYKIRIAPTENCRLLRLEGHLAPQPCGMWRWSI